MKTLRNAIQALADSGDYKGAKVLDAQFSVMNSAPDLLMACRELIAASNRFQNGARDGGTMGQISAAMGSARAAIAKAEGRADG